MNVPYGDVNIYEENLLKIVELVTKVLLTQQRVYIIFLTSVMFVARAEDEGCSHTSQKKCFTVLRIILHPESDKSCFPQRSGMKLAAFTRGIIKNKLLSM